MYHVAIKDFKSASGGILCVRGRAYDIVDIDEKTGACAIHGCEDGEVHNTTWPKVEDYFATASKFIVIEVLERNVVEVCHCDTLREALQDCNERLLSRVKQVNRMDEFEAGDGENAEWGMANPVNMAAWCNWRDNWDAYIITT